MYKFQDSDTNEVLLVGRIINLYFTRGDAIITLNCGNKTYPKIFATAKVLEDKRNIIREGMIVSICGNLQHSNRETFTSYGIWANEIEVFYEQEQPVPLYTCAFYVSGEIVKVKPKEAISIIYLKSHTNGRLAIVPITVFNPKWQLKKGDYFQCCGTVQTWRRQGEDGVTKYYESYVAKSYM